MTSRQLLRGLVISCLLIPGFASAAEPGLSTDEVRIGMVNAQSGPAAALGLGMLNGAQAYFKRINAEGGVHGRRITLLSRDDGYEPSQTAAHTRSLLKTQQVFALLGYVGTPTSRAAVPLALRAQVPYLFPFTGAEFLRTPARPGVFNIRASYIEETEHLVERMTQDLKLSKIAILMQDDSFGESVKGGLNGALVKRDLTIHAQARIQRNSLDVTAAIKALQRTQPEAVFFVGTYRQLAASIKQAKALGFNTRFISVSFIGTEGFIREIGRDGDGVYISQVVPSPDDRSLALVRAYQADMQPSDFDHASLEGYIGAAVFTQALRKAGTEPTRETFLDALEHLETDLGGFKVAFSRSQHQGSSAVFLTRIENGQAVPVKTMR
ncbi:ABC transporter substrate-binding protein [Pseudomonas peli]|uniref:ABC transporter substrate-binding protein n=1 Tax=Pseudomonas peli TaxID=592361 RepID=UPI00285B2FAE|nr:ABC transporter substrate-binding protein [Pseudomonas peli]MDR7023172.1 ABC-type branched-subunit amino acid transport system substrate-binding protein [Pseudomonas peli]